MTWKEKQTITILLSILGVLSAVLLVVLAVRYRENRPAAPAGGTGEDGAVSGTVTDPTALTDVSFENGSATLRFSLNEEGNWIWADDPGFPLDSATVDAIISLASDLRFQQTLPNTESLESYGLDTPSAVLTLTTGGEDTKTLAFGKATTDGNSRYLMIDGDETTLYIIDGTLYKYLQTPIYNMMDLPDLPDLSQGNLRSLTIYGPRQEAAEEGGEETPENTPEETAPAAVLTARQSSGENSAALWFSDTVNVTTNSALLNLLADLKSLAVTRCVDYRPSEEALTICGFDAPEATLEAEYGTEDRLTLAIGKKEPNGGGRYVWLNGETTVYLVPEESVDGILQIAASGLN